jgi:hypothetical protein
LYDYGMLDHAKRVLVKTMNTLKEEIDGGMPIVFLEPSCASVFRDELVNLFPSDPRATRLREQTYLLGEFLNKFAKETPLPALHRKVLAHAHCHHKAVLGTDGEKALFDRLGVDYELPNNGCCGMAGSFGFEEGEKYEVSVAVGEHELLPKGRRSVTPSSWRKASAAASRSRRKPIARHSTPPNCCKWPFTRVPTEQQARSRNVGWWSGGNGPSPNRW